MIASGEITEDSDLFLDKIVDRDGPGTPGGSSFHHGKSKGEVDKEAIQNSASYWQVTSNAEFYHTIIWPNHSIVDIYV